MLSRLKLFALISLFVLIFASAAFPVSTAQLQADIEQILSRSSVINNTWSIMIANESGAMMYYAQDPDTPRKPASNTKLWTTACSYEVLGWNHWWNGDYLVNSIKPINKNSDNYLADSLCKHLGSELRGSYSLWAGADVCLDWARDDLGIDMTGAEMYDGSGLSHSNRFTARQTISLLRHMVTTYTSWDDSLAIGCVDGTISGRFCGTVGSGRVHAKTGTLTGVIALSGYIDNPYDGERYLFSFLANNVSSSYATRDAIDDCVVLLGQGGIPNTGSDDPGVIVDNNDPGFIYSGSWSQSSGYGFYETDSLYAVVGGGEDVARWTPNLPQTGKYEVYVWWVDSWNRSSDAEYKIYHASGMSTHGANQTANGGQWMSLGTYNFTQGSDGFVTLADTGDGSVVSADAMRFVYRGPVEVVVDNNDAGFSSTGVWDSSANSGYYGTNSLYAFVGGDTDVATWTPSLPMAGHYEVYVWWVAAANRSSDAVYTINHAGGQSTHGADQTANGGQWMSIGSYNFHAGSNGGVSLEDVGNGTVVSADAVRFLYRGPASVIVDNMDPGFSASANWFESTSVSGYYASNYHARATESVSDAASFSADLTAGSYDVYARWTTASNRASAAPFIVYHSGGSDTVYCDQTADNGVWKYLGSYSMDSGYQTRVAISCWTSSGDYVIADAVKFVKQ